MVDARKLLLSYILPAQQDTTTPDSQNLRQLKSSLKKIRELPELEKNLELQKVSEASRANVVCKRRRKEKKKSLNKNVKEFRHLNKIKREYSGI